MNRRAFLSAFTRGVVAAAVLASVPTAALKAVGLTEPARRYACEYLLKVWREATRGQSGRVPTRIEAGHELFVAYEAELEGVMRFVPGQEFGFRAMAFKACTLVDAGPGWWAKVVA